MQQCREPYRLALSRRLAHGCQSVRRGIPAQCPGRGRLTAVPLGRGPSLHGLRRGNALVVRPLHRYYSLVRLLIRVHAHRSAFAFTSRSGMPRRTRMRPPRFRTKNFTTCARPSTARGSSIQANTLWGMLPSRQRTRSAPRNSTRFAAQYSARGLPCERFTAVLADRTSCITRGRGGWLDLPRGGLAPPILCQLSWRTLLWVKGGRHDYVGIASAIPQIADDLLHRRSRRSRATSGPIKSGCHRNIAATSVMMQASPSRIWTPTTARKTGEV